MKKKSEFEALQYSDENAGQFRAIAAILGYSEEYRNGDITSVSYTHLDVYKRQIRRSRTIRFRCFTRCLPQYNPSSFQKHQKKQVGVHDLLEVIKMQNEINELRKNGKLTPEDLSLIHIY